MLGKPQPLKRKESRSETSNRRTSLTNLTVLFCIVLTVLHTVWSCAMLYRVVLCCNWGVLSQLDNGGGSSQPRPLLDCFKRWQSDHACHHRQIQQACYKKKWKVEWEAQTGMCQWSTSTFQNSCGYRYAGVKGNDQADRMASKATLTSGLLFGRSEVLRSLRNYLQAHKPRTPHLRSPGG